MPGRSVRESRAAGAMSGGDACHALRCARAACSSGCVLGSGMPDARCEGRGGGGTGGARSGGGCGYATCRLARGKRGPSLHEGGERQAIHERVRARGGHCLSQAKACAYVGRERAAAPSCGCCRCGVVCKGCARCGGGCGPFVCVLVGAASFANLCKRWEAALCSREAASMQSPKPCAQRHTGAVPG